MREHQEVDDQQEQHWNGRVDMEDIAIYTSDDHVNYSHPLPHA